MYGDTEIIRGLARTMRDHATALRDEADVLLARAESVTWEGLAADAMRTAVRHQFVSLRATAGLADDAAEKLERHAAEVDRLKNLLAAIEKRARSMIAAARKRLSGLVDKMLPDPIDELLDRFVPPPPGSREWLTVDLPGLW